MDQFPNWAKLKERVAERAEYRRAAGEWSPLAEGDEELLDEAIRELGKMRAYQAIDAITELTKLARIEDEVPT
jgi:hypothetical protein